MPFPHEWFSSGISFHHVKMFTNCTLKLNTIFYLICICSSYKIIDGGTALNASVYVFLKGWVVKVKKWYKIKYHVLNKICGNFANLAN